MVTTTYTCSLFDRETADRHYMTEGLFVRSIHTSLILAIGTKAVHLKILLDEIIHRQRKFRLIMIKKVIKHSADHQIYVPSSVYFYLSHVRSLPWICVTSLINCEIWLQIKPSLNASLTLDTSALGHMLEIWTDSLLYRENRVILASAVWSKHA